MAVTNLGCLNLFSVVYLKTRLLPLYLVRSTTALAFRSFAISLRRHENTRKSSKSLNLVRWDYSVWYTVCTKHQESTVWILSPRTYTC